jgi:hypothetical protein
LPSRFMKDELNLDIKDHVPSDYLEQLK